MRQSASTTAGPLCRALLHTRHVVWAYPGDGTVRHAGSAAASPDAYVKWALSLLDHNSMLAGARADCPAE
jgi:hypothetical protein